MNAEKEKLLNEIIDFCEDGMSVWWWKEGAHARGYGEALGDVAEYCRSLLGYSGNMPTEVPNQSEDTK